jgi:hypothetical protein
MHGGERVPVFLERTSRLAARTGRGRNFIKLGDGEAGGGHEMTNE